MQLVITLQHLLRDGDLCVMQRCVTCHDTDRGDRDFYEKNKTIMRTICPQSETQNEREAKFIQTTGGGHMGKSGREQLTTRGSEGQSGRAEVAALWKHS